MKNCRLCLNLLDPTYWNNPLFESTNFVVLPSLGALVEGWLLLLPKDHFICMGALPESLISEMEELKATVSQFLQRCFGAVSAFEHGPHQENLKLGCGVDHAHLHLVPVSFSLVEAIAPLLPSNARWTCGGMQTCRNAYLERQDYLYLEQPIGEGLIATHTGLGAQLFRRAIAFQLGIPDEYNWREYPQLRNIDATIEKVRTAERGEFLCQTPAKAAA